MTTDVVTVTPETTLKEVAKLLIDRRIAGVPVCGAAGGVLGVVSESNILWKELRSLPENGHVIRRILDAAYADDKRAKAATAREAMTSPAVTIGPEEPIARAARLMLEHMINRLPVVSEGLSSESSPALISSVPSGARTKRSNARSAPTSCAPCGSILAAFRSP